jgi:post-segregation antitoxin (ccd killing protein)
MSVHKIAVSLPPGLADEVREDARAAGLTVSGWLADAAARKLRRKQARAVLAEYEAEHGPVTSDELAEVRRRWPG